MIFVFRFLASLTDIKHKMKGKTVLYIPNEGLHLTVEVVAKNKELVQRLESNFVIILRKNARFKTVFFMHMHQAFCVSLTTPAQITCFEFWL